MCVYYLDLCFCFICVRRWVRSGGDAPSWRTSLATCPIAFTPLGCWSRTAIHASRSMYVQIPPTLTWRRIQVVCVTQYNIICTMTIEKLSH